MSRWYLVHKEDVELYEKLRDSKDRNLELFNRMLRLADCEVSDAQNYVVFYRGYYWGETRPEVYPGIPVAPIGKKKKIRKRKK